jgi:hypothetical protein
LSKKYQVFYFFSIENPALFKPVLKKLADEQITSSTHAMAHRYTIQKLKAAEAEKKAEEQTKKKTRSTGGGGFFGILGDVVESGASMANSGIDIVGSLANTALDVTIGVAKFPFEVFGHLVPKDAKDIPRSKGSKSHMGLAQVNISFTHVGVNKVNGIIDLPASSVRV